MKRNKLSLIIMLAAVLLPTVLRADQYKVTFINHGQVRVGGKNLAKGDEFGDENSITWSDESQVMKVVNLQRGRMSVLSAKEMNLKSGKSLAEYLVQTKHLSTRGEEDYNGQELYVADSIFLPPAEIEGVCEYILSRHTDSANGHKYQTLPVTDDGQIVISIELLGRHRQRPITVDIYYLLEGCDTPEQYIQELKLIPLNIEK